MQIEDELIAHLEELSRLRLTGEERELTRQQLGRVLGYFDKLSELPTGAETAPRPAGGGNVLRDDLVLPSLGRDEMLRGAPQQAGGCFRVPKTVE